MRGENSILSALYGEKLPVILQAEAAECGLACIAMIANFHGYEVDINTLRRRYPASLRGARLTDLIDLAGQLGLGGRAVRLEIEDLVNLKTPAILHWGLNHFVVLKKAGRRKILIHDPAFGARNVELDEISSHFTGVALELTPSDTFQPAHEARVLRLRDLWTRISGLAGSLGQIIGVSLAIQAFVLVLPLQMQLVVDEALVVEDEDLLLVLLAGFIGVVLFHALTEALRSRMLAHLSAQLQLQLMNNLFHHLLQLPLSFFERRHVGDIVSRFGSTHQINALFSYRLISVFMDAVFSIATLAMMFAYEARLAFLALGMTVSYALIRLALLVPHRSRAMEEIGLAAREQSIFIETLRAIQGIRLYGAEIIRETVWRNQLAARLNARMRVSFIEVAEELARKLTLGILAVLLLYFGARLVIDRSISIGMLLAFIAYSAQFEARAAAFINQLMQLRLVSLHLERLADIVHTEKEEVGSAHAVSGRSLEGHLALSNIAFQYDRQSPHLFRNVNLEIRKGEFVAIAGMSGQGKTTLLKIMLGLLEPTDGDVLIDGIPLRTFGLASFRRQCATVMQDDQLLTGTIADNITFFDGVPDLEHMRNCAHLTAIDSDIMAMPMGYDSMVGDMGATLSGGQKQRILLARALYKRPSILFMDEGTANLDVATERKINENLKSLDMTRVIIAHRPDMLLSADRIVELRGGDLLPLEKRFVPIVHSG